MSRGGGDAGGSSRVGSTCAVATESLRPCLTHPPRHHPLDVDMGLPAEGVVDKREAIPHQRHPASHPPRFQYHGFSVSEATTGASSKSATSILVVTMKTARKTA